MQRRVHLQIAYVDADDLGKVFGQTLHLDGTQTLLEETTAGLDPDRFARGFDDDFGHEGFVHGNGLEVDMQDGAGPR